jgi:hypothetical protein
MSSNALAVITEYGHTQKQAEELLSHIIPAGKTVTEEQLRYFLNIAKMHGLNPLADEIQLIPFKGLTISCYITQAGLFKIARKIPNYIGIEVIPFYKNDVFGFDSNDNTCIVQYDNNRNSENLAGVIGVLKRKDMPNIKSIVFLSEFKERGNLWLTKQYVMLEKTVRMKLIRSMGFSGVYCPEEMGIPVTENKTGTYVVEDVTPVSTALFNEAMDLAAQFNADRTIKGQAYIRTLKTDAELVKIINDMKAELSRQAPVATPVNHLPKKETIDTTTGEVITDDPLEF